ncbi:MAG: DUF4381 domain-containing protein [bacterium]|nr:DUF4381 domain-containing protein [bacterium]
MIPEDFGNPWMANLTEIGAPDAVPWWPPAPGWYAVVVVVIIVLLRGVWLLIRRWRANAYRRDAMQELRSLDVDNSQGMASMLTMLPDLLKRVALTAFPRIEVAALSGPTWHQFLDRTMHEKRFTGEVGETLDRVAYVPDTDVPSQDGQRLLAAAARWIVRHRAGVD